MSLLTKVEAVPSRCTAVLRLVHALSPASEEEVANLFWPPALRKDTSTAFDRAVIAEMKAAGVLLVEEGIATLSPPVAAAAADPVALQCALAEHLFAQEANNDDLGMVLAWWLALPLAELPQSYQALVDAWKTLGLEENAYASMNQVTRAHMVRSWATYLGLGWEEMGPEEKYLHPDPTELLRIYFSTLSTREVELPFADVWSEVTARFPYFDGGRLHTRVLDAVGARPLPGHLTESTSFALLRLHDEQRITLVDRADVEVYVLSWTAPNVVGRQHARATGRISHLIVHD